MIYSILATLFLLLPVVISADPPCVATDPLTPEAICSIRAAFGGSQIVPNMLPSFLPTGILQVTYGTVTLGGAQQMSPSRVNTAPLVAVSQVPGTTMGPYYTLIMYDGTDNTINLIQTDLSVQSGTLDLISNTDPVVSYQSPNPATGSGVHEYLFLLYTQSGSSLKITPPTSLSGFNLQSFVKQYFPGATSPAAGMFFKSQFDGVTFTTASGGISSATSTPAVQSNSSTTKSITTATTIVTTTQSKGKQTSTSAVGTSSGSSSTSSSNSGPQGGGNPGGQISGALRGSGFLGLILVGSLSFLGSLLI